MTSLKLKNTAMYKGQQDLLKSQMSAEEADNLNSTGDENIFEREPIPGTPFHWLHKDEKWYLLMGKYRLNDRELDTKDELDEYLEKEYYQITLRMIMICINTEKEEGERELMSKLKAIKGNKL